MDGKITDLTSLSKLAKPGLRILLAFVFAFIGLFCFRSALAKPSADTLQVEMRSTSLLFMDTNKFCATKGSEGPDGAWYHLRITNPLLHQTYTGLQLTLTSPESIIIADPVRYLGTLEPNHSEDLFFFVNYSALRNWGTCSNGKTPDDYSSALTATITSIDNGMNGVKTFQQAFTADGITSASAGGMYVSHDLGPGAYVGQIMTTTVLYSFGNNTARTPLFVQPTGNGNFNAACYRLARSRVVSSNVAGVAAGMTNILWFPSTTTDSNDVVRMEYEFELRCTTTGTTSSIPWSTITSGGDQKYASENFTSTSPGGGGVPLPSPRPVVQALNVTASVTPTLLIDGGVATYTLRIENLVDVPIYVDNILGRQSNGLTYAGFGQRSNINAHSSSISPTLRTRGPLAWYGIPYLTFQIPPSGTLGIGQPGSIELVYTAEVTGETGSYTTWLSATVGGSTTPPIGLTVNVEKTTAVTLAGFSALPEPEGVRLNWTTALEINTIGFHLFRRRLPDGVVERITPTLIMAEGTGEVNAEPLAYTWLDTSAQSGVDYAYWLEEWTISGPPEKYGPAYTRELLNTTLPTGPYLPLILR